MTTAYQSWIKTDPCEEIDYWRGVLAAIEWRLLDYSLDDEPHPPVPGTDEPSRYNAGVNGLLLLSPNLDELPDLHALATARIANAGRPLQA